MFEGNQMTTNIFIQELKIYQFLNATHLLMVDPYSQVTHTLMYL